MRKRSRTEVATVARALKARGHAVEVINAGVSGDTTANGLARVAWAVPRALTAWAWAGAASASGVAMASSANANAFLVFISAPQIGRAHV